ncbi:MAG: hypothetical protein EA420_00955 [Candidatus Competibacteraceae bacterium]|nr:MAG: hypothetical protein EA420_00955 [Candidatus Competibacteraceae bacterium]
MKRVAVILTLNEARHLPRCLASLTGVADAVLVADSFSTDSHRGLVGQNFPDAREWLQQTLPCAGPSCHHHLEAPDHPNLFANHRPATRGNPAADRGRDGAGLTRTSA